MWNTNQNLGSHSGTWLRALSAALAVAVVLVSAVVVLVLTAQPAQAQTYSVLYSFHGKHGASPQAGLIRDKKGDLYGTTRVGGTYEEGVVFKLTANDKERVLYSFTGGTDGASPQAGLVRDSSGNLYGTTWGGGAHNDGAVFKLDTAGAETVLHSFAWADGGAPNAGLVRDSAGNLYGTTFGGGAYEEGVVFKLDTTGAETVLYSFAGGTDGRNPCAGLVRDSAGNLYGTTCGGGAYGYGVVFKLTANDKEKVLYSFTGGVDGAGPWAGLVRDSAGNLYGTTNVGGAYGYGVVFKLTANDKERVLYSFTGGVDGRWPSAGLVRDSAGNLYGTTFNGGDPNCAGGLGCGTVFRVDASGTETVLHMFSGADGSNPYAGLLRDSKGSLYGTTYYGGVYGYGVVFKINPAMTTQESRAARFPPSDASLPVALAASAYR
jgi:uncharacterized repeat protein (TIGR03803 family)